MFLKIKKQLKLRIIIFLLSSKVEWNQIYKILAKIETSRLSNTNNLDLKCFLSISAINALKLVSKEVVNFWQPLFLAHLGIAMKKKLLPKKKE